MVVAVVIYARGDIIPAIVGCKEGWLPARKIHLVGVW